MTSFDPRTTTRPDAPDVGSARRGVLPRGSAIARYMILSLVGRGGMSEVYAAYDPELDRRIALKVLHSTASRARLLREARALGKLSHPNVVHVYEVGEDGGDVFVAMELVEGEDLVSWVRRDPKPPWREVLDAYLDAAHGLAAAHAQGLVHRDVKPSNIVRGSDGRVRVIDFGLVVGDAERDAPPPPGQSSRDVTGADALADETLPAPFTASDSSGHAVTLAGDILGTPRYMAPEQFDGARVGPAADQYGFCLALYEALYGGSPFEPPGGSPARTLFDLIEAKLAPLPEAPPSSSVPAWIYKALRRGLSPKPEGRFGSIEELVAALGDDPLLRRRARRRVTLAVLGAASLATLAAVGWARSGAFQDRCAYADRELGGVWDGAAKSRVRDALRGTGRSYADETATRVLARLDAYASSHVAARRQVCEAARSGQERVEVSALRDACLDRRRGSFEATVSVLGEKPDVDRLDHATTMVDDLPRVASCADVAALTSSVRPPEDAPTRARVDAVQARIDRLEALEIAASTREGVALADGVLADAEATRYPPVIGAARYWVARLAEDTGDDARAKALLYDSASAAAEGGDEPQVELAWARVLFLLGERERRFDEAAVVRSFGPTLRGLTSDVTSRAAWLNAEGLLLYRVGDAAGSRRLHEEALALLERDRGAKSLHVARALHNLGLALTALGDYSASLDVHRRALAIYVDTLGPDHPTIATATNNLGVLLFDSGDYRGAEEQYRRAADIAARAFGPDAVEGSSPQLNLGNILFVTGDFAGARAAYERVLAIEEKAYGEEHTDVALAISNLAETALAMGDAARAEELGVRALAIRDKTLGPDNLDTTSTALTVGRARIRAGRPGEAEPLLVHALAAKEKALDASDSRLADALQAMGELRIAQKRPADALPFLERALTLGDAYSKPETQLTLAETLIGKDPVRARGLVADARVAYERLGHKPGLARAAAVLARLPATAR